MKRRDFLKFIPLAAAGPAVAKGLMEFKPSTPASPQVFTEVCSLNDIPYLARLPIWDLEMRTNKIYSTQMTEPVELTIIDDPLIPMTICFTTTLIFPLSINWEIFDIEISAPNPFHKPFERRSKGYVAQTEICIGPQMMEQRVKMNFIHDLWTGSVATGRITLLLDPDRRASLSAVLT